MMRVHDALYGAFDLPDFVEPLLFSPEFQRLRQIGLININSPTVAALSDVSRYSHTIGTLFLATRSAHIGYSEDELKAFLAALIFHDAGSPAFGHLIEYRLKEKYNFNHESILVGYLHGTHHPDSLSHQVQGQTIRFKKLCDRSRIDVSILEKILSSKHPLSSLIFGSLDYDNIDNVARMAYFLGLKPNIDHFVDIAQNIGVAGGELMLPEQCEASVAHWSDCRHRAYNILVFDETAVARQAVVSKAYDLAAEDGFVGLNDWDWPETELLQRVAESPRAKRVMRRFYHEAPPRRAVHLHLADSELGDKVFTGGQLREALTSVLRQHFPGRQTFQYVFIDRGTFSKRVTFASPDSGHRWSYGRKSSSLVLDGFVSGAAPTQSAVAEATAALRRVLV